MHNNAPNSPKKRNGKQKYKQGNYIPKNREKIIKFNSQGGVYYRSGFEYKVYAFFDLSEHVKVWGAEIMGIPYTKKQVNKTKWGEYQWSETQHTYYPDAYYELELPSGKKRKILAEIKPLAETRPPKISSKNATNKQLENYEYAFKMYNANLAKWEAAIEYCKTRDIEFVIITEQFLKNLKNG